MKMTIDCLIIFGNLIVLVVLKRNRVLKRSTHQTMLHLAIADLLVGVVGLVKNFLDVLVLLKVAATWLLLYSKDVCRVMMFTVQGCCGCSMTGLLLLSIDGLITMRSGLVGGGRGIPPKINGIIIGMTWLIWSIYSAAFAWVPPTHSPLIYHKARPGCYASNGMFQMEIFMFKVALFVGHFIAIMYCQGKTLSSIKHQMEGVGKRSTVRQGWFRSASVTPYSDPKACNSSNRVESISSKLQQHHLLPEAKMSFQASTSTSTELTKVTHLQQLHESSIAENCKGERMPPVYAVPPPMALMVVESLDTSSLDNPQGKTTHQLPIGPQRKTTHQPPPTNRAQRLQLERFIKLRKTIIIMITLYGVCWAPVEIVALAHVVCPHSCKSIGQYLPYCGIFAISNSFMNVIVYLIRSKDFRQQCCDMFHCKKQ